MGFFTTKLRELLEHRTQAEVAAASGLPRSSIAQYATGDRGISVGALGELLRAFPDRDDQIALVAAHLKDEIPPELYGGIDIHVPDNPAVGEPSPYAKELDNALQLIRQRAEKDEDVLKLVLDLEKVLR